MTAEERAVVRKLVSLSDQELCTPRDAVAALLAAHDRYEKALREIKSIAAPCGSERGDAEIHKIAREALCESSSL